VVLIRFDITKLAVGWVSGEYTNYGLAIVGENEISANYKVIFSSSETSNEELIPRIEVNESPK